MKRTLSILLALCLCLSLSGAALAEEAQEQEDSFRTLPGYTCFPLVADNEWPGRFLVDAPMDWDGGDFSMAYEVPTVMAMPDMLHAMMVVELSAQTQAEELSNPDSMLAGFIEEGLSVTAGNSTEGSRILEQFDLHGLPATRVNMVGQGYEMVWIADGEDLWYFMYPVDKDDKEYTAVVEEMIDSFTVFEPVSIGDSPAEDFTWTADERGVTITGYVGEAVYVRVPAEIDGQPVVALGDEAFYETDVRSVALPDTVTEMGTFVFSGCNSLASVRLPAHLETLPRGTFESCYRLVNAGLNEGLVRMEDTVFWANQYLYILSLPDSLAEIGQPNFVGCIILSYFLVGEDCAGFAASEDEGVLFSRDGKRLLRYGANHQDSAYTVPDGVEVIDPYAFHYCYELTEITLPDSLRAIGGLAFAMTGVSEITIPEGAAELGFLPNILNDQGELETVHTVIGNETVIHGVPGSAAEEYAQKYNKTFVPLDSADPEEEQP